MSEYGTGTYGGGGYAPAPPEPPTLTAADERYLRLLNLTCMIRHRTDVTDDSGDVTTTETTEGPWPCHAYQDFAMEFVQGKMIGREDLVVHLLPQVSVTTGDRIDISWPNGRTVEAEIVGPPAYRVNARTGAVHHIEARSREIH